MHFTQTIKFRSQIKNISFKMSRSIYKNKKNKKKTDHSEQCLAILKKG